MIKKPKKPCPCHSGKEYAVCCKPFHQGTLPENALLLMRSRYAAYALNLSEYIMETTHPLSPLYSNNKPSWKQSISQFSKNSSFNDLKILDFTETGNLAEVTFTAYISQNGQDATFTEKSFFEKKNNRWLYLGGQVSHAAK
jgi:SEC-C motif domain protein